MLAFFLFVYMLVFFPICISFEHTVFVQQKFGLHKQYRKYGTGTAILKSISALQTLPLKNPTCFFVYSLLTDVGLTEVDVVVKTEKQKNTWAVADLKSDHVIKLIIT